MKTSILSNMKIASQNKKKMNKLFDIFDPVSAKQWKQKIQVDLKGADYNDTLIWKAADGIDVKPFYHSDDFKDDFIVSETKSTVWRISQSINVDTAEESNSIAKDALEKGAEHIIFNIQSKTVNLSNLVSGINHPIHFNFRFFSESLVEELSQLQHTKFTYNNDIIGYLGKTGNWFSNLNDDHNALEKSVRTHQQLYIDLSHYQNAGATHVQQLAYALAHTTEYLNHFDEKLDASEKQSIEVIFNVAVGSNYFFEIGKLRALRQLWNALAEPFGFNTTCQIHTTPSKRNKTIYDYNVNMLRTTTESMSAILGGADIIYNRAYNSLFQNATEFGERISRNQLLILKNESYFDVVKNPANGAYYIESLTQQLCEKALTLFKTIEKSGGFSSQLKEGVIQRKIKESAQKEQEAFDAEQIILLGTNKHPNRNDEMAQNLEKQPFLSIEKRKTLLEPIIEKRLSETIEQNRLKEERTR